MDLEFKSSVAGSNVSITEPTGTDDIQISVTAGSGMFLINWEVDVPTTITSDQNYFATKVIVDSVLTVDGCLVSRTC